MDGCIWLPLTQLRPDLTYAVGAVTMPQSDVSLLFRREILARLHHMGGRRAPRKTWPEGCYGSGASWLMFVGPSPGGNSDSVAVSARRRRTHGRCLWNEPFEETYGKCPGAWGGKYRENIPALVETILSLPLSDGSAKLFGFANFDWVPSPQEHRVSKRRMVEGESDVLKVLKLTRPRVIAPTTKLAYERLVRCLRREGYDFFRPAHQCVRIRIDPRGAAFHRQMDAVKIRGSGVLEGAVVVRLPQHPARMLYGHHGHRCAKAVRSALVQVYGERPALVIDEV